MVLLHRASIVSEDEKLQAVLKRPLSQRKKVGATMRVPMNALRQRTLQHFPLIPRAIAG
jgi:hypothetical protein